MRNMSKLAKFFIITAIIFGVGTAMTIGGIVAGGIAGLDNFADDHTWFSASPGATTIKEYNDTKYDKIKIDGAMDVKIAGPEYHKELKKEVSSRIDTTCGEAGDVCIVGGENVKLPELDNGSEEGVLHISAVEDNEGQVQLNLTNKESMPTVYIFASKDTIKNLEITSQDNDIEIKDLTFDKANINLSNSDLEMEYVRSNNLNIKSQNSDVELDGEFKGDTKVVNSNGDVKFTTAQDTATYETNLKALYGEIEVGDGDVEIDGEPYTWQNKGGPSTLTIDNENGDVKVWFGDTLF